MSILGRHFCGRRGCLWPCLSTSIGYGRAGLDGFISLCCYVVFRMISSSINNVFFLGMLTCTRYTFVEVSMSATRQPTATQMNRQERSRDSGMVEWLWPAQLSDSQSTTDAAPMKRNKTISFLFKKKIFLLIVGVIQRLK